ncbi:MAG: hypothetical protein ABJ313_02565 [Cyclobacteriaceae bacterium]
MESDNPKVENDNRKAESDNREAERDNRNIEDDSLAFAGLQLMAIPIYTKQKILTNTDQDSISLS